MWKYNSRTIRTGKAWTDDNGVQHPANWHVWSATEKAAAGLTEVVEETPRIVVFIIGHKTLMVQLHLQLKV